MGGVVTFMGVCDTYGKLLDTYGSFVIFMGVVTFMGRTIASTILLAYSYFPAIWSLGIHINTILIKNGVYISGKWWSDTLRQLSLASMG